MNDQAFNNLAGAVLLRALHDLRYGSAKVQADAEQFLAGDWAQDLALVVFDTPVSKMVEAAASLTLLPPVTIMLEFSKRRKAA